MVYVEYKFQTHCIYICFSGIKMTLLITLSISGVFFEFWVLLLHPSRYCCCVPHVTEAAGWISGWVHCDLNEKDLVLLGTHGRRVQPRVSSPPSA